MPKVLEPVGSRILVREDSFKYTGLLKIPDTAKRRPTTGIIEAIGPDVDADRWPIGAKVLYPQFSGSACEFREVGCWRVLSADEILAFVHTEDELVGVSS
jgi:co-chaperonin GroES (HSP10)